MPAPEADSNEASEAGRKAGSSISTESLILAQDERWRRA
jgi:hypothetical protein